MVGVPFLATRSIELSLELPNARVEGRLRVLQFLFEPLVLPYQVVHLVLSAVEHTGQLRDSIIGIFSMLATIGEVLLELRDTILQFTDFVTQLVVEAIYLCEQISVVTESVHYLYMRLQFVDTCQRIVVICLQCVVLAQKICPLAPSAISFLN